MLHNRDYRNVINVKVSYIMVNFYTCPVAPYVKILSTRNLFRYPF